jgi:hypothetical protein
VASCVLAQVWMHLPEAALHMQLASALQAPRALYSRPQRSVHLAPFHWHVLSRAHSALDVERLQEILQALAAGFHAQPVCARHMAWLGLFWQLVPHLPVAEFHWQLMSLLQPPDVLWRTAHCVKQVRNCEFHAHTSLRAWHMTCDATVAHACLQSLAVASQMHVLSAAQSWAVGFLSAQPGAQPVDGAKEQSVLAEQSAAFLALAHVPMQAPVATSHAQSGSVVHWACVAYLNWQRAVQPVPLTTWHVAEAPQVAGSTTAEHLPVHLAAAASHTQSDCDEHASAVVARKTQRVRHALPEAMHMDSDSHVDTLMGSVSDTGIWSHASLHTRLALSHMQARSPAHCAAVV